jgi:ubiquinone biosynthesis protein UbiJ
LIAESLLAAGLDRLFAQTPGARELLAGHAGRTLALDFTLFRARLRVEEGGGLLAAPETAVDATIFLTPDVLLRLPAQGKAALRELRTEGDAELLSAFNDAIQQLDLDAEAELSRLFGPIAGFRLAEAGRALTGWMQQALDDTARTFAEYAVEESPMLASKIDLARFNREVDQLRDDAARLEARLAQLEKAE